jgi:hypothetical protein
METTQSVTRVSRTCLIFSSDHRRLLQKISAIRVSEPVIVGLDLKIDYGALRAVPQSVHGVFARESARAAVSLIVPENLQAFERREVPIEVRISILLSERQFCREGSAFLPGKSLGPSRRTDEDPTCNRAHYPLMNPVDSAPPSRLTSREAVLSIVMHNGFGLNSAPGHDVLKRSNQVDALHQGLQGGSGFDFRAQAPSRHCASEKTDGSRFSVRPIP